MVSICSSSLGKTGRVLRNGRARSAGRAGDRRDPDGLPERARTAPRSGRMRAASSTPSRFRSSRVRRRSGRCVVGFSLDQEAARAIQAAHQQRDRVRRSGRRIVASTLDPERTAGTGRLSPARPGIFASWLGDRGIRRAGAAARRGRRGRDEPVALVLRSRTEHLRFLPPLRWQIAHHRPRRGARRDGRRLRHRAHGDAAAAGADRDDARDGGDRRPGAAAVPARRPMGRRGRAAARDDVRPAHRRARPVSARRRRSASGCRRSAGSRPSSRTRSATR